MRKIVRNCRWSCRFSPTPGKRVHDVAAERLRRPPGGRRPTVRADAACRSRRRRARFRRRARASRLTPSRDVARRRPRAGPRTISRSTCAPVDDAQVRAAEDRLEEAARRAPAPAAPLVDLEIGGAFVVAAVEVVDLGDADLGRRVAHRVEDRPGDARPLDPPFAARAVQLVGAAVMVLVALEDRAARRPSPSRRGRAGASRRSRRPGRACRSCR